MQGKSCKCPLAHVGISLCVYGSAWCSAITYIALGPWKLIAEAVGEANQPIRGIHAGIIGAAVLTSKRRPPLPLPAFVCGNATR